MIRNDVYMASVWPLTWKSNNPDPAATGGFRSLIDPETGELRHRAIFDAFLLAAEGRMASLKYPSPIKFKAWLCRPPTKIGAGLPPE